MRRYDIYHICYKRMAVKILTISALLLTIVLKNNFMVHMFNRNEHISSILLVSDRLLLNDGATIGE